MITSLRLQDFRSYKDETFEFTTGVSIIVGPNASGKTNLLEAILVLCRGGSYRAKDIDLVTYERPWARLEGQFDAEQRIVTIERQTESKALKKYKINTQEFRRLSLQKTVPVVVFEPEHLLLMSSGPERRREYMDELLEKSISGYGKLRRDYKRALAQRNYLLKRLKSPTEAELFAWNVRLSETGGQIAQYRARLIETCNKSITELYQDISHTDASVRLHYLSPINIESYNSQLLKNLEANLAIDRERGFTSFGPHREDMIVTLNDHDAKTSASRGEVRTLLLTLKLLELKIVEQSRQKRPLLLLDDVFSELDGARRKALTKFLKDYQTFITTTDADVVIQHFVGNCTIIPTNSN